MLVHHHPAQPGAATDMHVGQDHRVLDLGVAVHVHPREQQGVAHQRTADDVAAGDQRIDRHAATAVVVEDELGRRQLLLVGPDRPVVVVEVQLRGHLGQFHVGFPVGIDGAGVAPVGNPGFVHADAGIGEVVGEHPVAVDAMRDQVLAEVVRGLRIVVVADQLFVEEVGIEDIHAHAGQGAVRASGDRRWILGFLDEGRHALPVVDLHDAEFRGLEPRHIDAGNAEIRLAFGMLGQHARVVHLVDVIAGKHQHVLGPVAPDQVEVLEHRIGGPPVPVFAELLLRRQDVDELVEAAVEEAPAALQVLDQALRLVLGGDADAPDAGVHAIRQREIDDAELAAEGHGGLRTPVGELHQAAAAAAGEYDAEGIAGDFTVSHDAASSRPIPCSDPMPHCPGIDCMVNSPLRLQSIR